MESNLKVVIVNGMPGSGKTTFENYAKSIPNVRVEIVSTIDVIKRMAAFGGWKGEKDLKARKMLSDLKDLMSAYNDLSFQSIIRFIKTWEDGLREFHVLDQPHVLFVDSREPEEIQRFKDELGAITVLIRRPDVESAVQSNHADANVFNFAYDYYIFNDADKEDLEKAAISFLDLIFKEN